MPAIAGLEFIISGIWHVVNRVSGIIGAQVQALIVMGKIDQVGGMDAVNSTTVFELPIVTVNLATTQFFIDFRKLPYVAIWKNAVSEFIHN
jgi:hypothetical protein